ncbi:hypothetical protein ACFHWW_27370 [Ensifer sp. P24N7]|uniref:hypothetical protein n=1 Tax=Sinorhizobium sp. P24N7 TaxID=3348358 RepID=UPI0035F34E0C
MTEDEATIINYALTDIGAGPMFSIDDDSELAEQIQHVWQPVVDRCFGMHYWSFARKTYRLTRLSATPGNGFSYGFELPGGRIGNPLRYAADARCRSPIRDFTLEAGQFFCDQADVWSQCRVYVAPTHWPPEWRAAFITALGAYLAVPVWQDRQMRDDMLVEAFGTTSRDGAGGVFGRLMAQDAASQPQGDPQTWDEPLSNARFNSGRDHWAGRYAFD